MKKQLGAEFIGRRLGSLINLGENEQLEPTSVRYAVQSAVNVSGETTGEQVVAARANFGRLKNGLRIVGGGSFVSVTLSNSGSIIGFSFDWPSYEELAASQSTVAVDVMSKRAATVGPLGQNESAKLERVNCGYYDRGSSRSDSGAPIRPACTVAYVASTNISGAVTSAGHEVVVPLGETFETDTGWPEAQWLKNPESMPTNETLLRGISPAANGK